MPASQSRRAVTTRRAVALAIGALVAVLLPTTSATAAKPAPDPTLATTIQFDSVGEGLDLGTAGTKDLWYVVQGRGFDVDLTFRDDAGNLEPLSQIQTLTITVKYGTTTLGTTDVAPGGTEASFSGLAIEAAASNVHLTVTASTKPKALTVSSRQFDVLIEDIDVDASALTSIGDGSDGSAPCVPAPGTVCGDLNPPFGQNFGPNGRLSLGVCAAGCVDRYVQALVTTDATSTNPATLVMKCDKDACGVGSIKKQKLKVTLAPGSLEPNDPLAVDYTAPACLEKGVVTYTPNDDVSVGNLPFCVDYVQSTRDNAGNTVLYLLFIEDAKVRFS
jgi:hypothetical protein